MENEASRIIELELPELMCIEYSLAPSEIGSAKNDGGSPAPTRETCLKVGTALLEALEDQQPIGVSFHEGELWALRERLSIYTSQGPRTDLGLVVKSKVYAALLSIANERSAKDALGEMPTARNGTGLSRQEVDDALRMWAEANGEKGDPGSGDRRAGADGAGDDAEDDPGTQAPSKS